MESKPAPKYVRKFVQGILCIVTFITIVTVAVGASSTTSTTDTVSQIQRPASTETAITH